MDQIELKATVREERGKEKAKKLRANGFIPGVVYHRGEETIAISLPGRQISKIIGDAHGENLLINLSLDKGKKKSRTVIIKEVQQDPFRRQILHVDFNEVSMNEVITVEVEVLAQGESIGVKQEGGVLDHPLRELKVQCLPADMPKHIDVDITNLKLNGSIHVKDLALPAGIKVLNDPEALLFQVKLPVEEKVEDAAAETPELEVIREKKEEEPKGGAAPKEEAKAKEAPKPEKK